MKIDVQGFESEVLQGAAQTLKRTRCLLIEANLVSHYAGDSTFASLYELLTTEFAFEFWSMTPPAYSPIGQALWCDAVFVNGKAATC